MTEIQNHSFSACCWTGFFNGGFERWQCRVGHGPHFADAEPGDVVADTDTGDPYFGGVAGGAGQIGVRADGGVILVVVTGGGVG